jgi:hypothetical protein
VLLDGDTARPDEAATKAAKRDLEEWINSAVSATRPADFRLSAIGGAPFIDHWNFGV